MILYDSDTCRFENLFSGFIFTLKKNETVLIISCLSSGHCSFNLSSPDFVHFSPLFTEDLDFLNERIDLSTFSDCVPIFQLMPIFSFFKDFQVGYVFESIFLKN